MKSVLMCLSFLLSFSVADTVQAEPLQVEPPQSGPVQCRYRIKDYASPGFGIPYRAGFYIRARFGCNYECQCADGSVVNYTHILEEKHFSMNVFSSRTGGAHAAKWFICPHSVKEYSWQPIRDELGRVLAYNVQANEDPFPASWLQSKTDQARFSSLCNK